MLNKVVFIFLICMHSLPSALADETVALFENLVPIEDPKVAVAYIDPNADFGVFKKVMVLETFVAFRSGWERDQRSGTRTIRITNNDIERIKADVSALFNEVLTERLVADNGYEVVEEAGEDVLLIRAAIIDLDITAPDTMSAGMTRTFTASTGAATLYLELFDSMSGQIIGRAADRQAIRNNGTVRWSTRVTNTADARRMFGRWADLLRSFLDSHYSD